MGNDVAYLETNEQLSVYKSVREAIWSRVKLNSRLMPYTRLLIEPLFAYNHFEDEDGLDFEEIDESDGSSLKSESDGDVDIDDTGVKVKIQIVEAKKKDKKKDKSSSSDSIESNEEEEFLE